VTLSQASAMIPSSSFRRAATGSRSTLRRRRSDLALALDRAVLAGELGSAPRPRPHPHEVLKQRVRGRRNAHDVERKERDDDAAGHMRRTAGQRGVDHT
jgi:hypothetical protein